ncbi:MAG TPA: hypothetical protein VEJ20_01965 [Candidatus Eremiobacteraceae bacterium]|nr:hypothetical protein [Candidatus Eremiobacteraceae bacterium]
MDSKKCSAALLAAMTLATSGCASTVTRWMVDLRTSQGEAALEHASLTEAEKEYALALRLDPHDANARAGLARVLYLQARADFTDSRLDQAQIDIDGSLAYAHGDPDATVLGAQIEQAKIRRDVVLANYPLYESAGTSLNDSLKSLAVSQKDIAKDVKSFGNDFDTGHLTQAIVASYDLEEETHRVTQRLISYRALVSTGTAILRVPTQEETPNLLPVP